MSKLSDQFFIRGVFDGDGCYEPNPNYPNCFRIRLYMNNYIFLNQLKDYFFNTLGIESYIRDKYKDPEKSTVKILNITKRKSVELFRDLIWADKKHIGIKRKKEVILNYRPK